jgi:hypothetical protein
VDGTVADTAVADHGQALATRPAAAPRRARVAAAEASSPAVRYVVVVIGTSWVSCGGGFAPEFGGIELRAAQAVNRFIGELLEDAASGQKSRYFMA